MPDIGNRTEYNVRCIENQKVGYTVVYVTTNYLTLRSAAVEPWIQREQQSG